jgi:hypothetical protein
MARSIYVMPMVGDGSKANPRLPKYEVSLFPTLSHSVFDYGDEPWCVVALQDVPPATDSALVANGDVFKLPDNLEQAVGAVSTRNQIRTKLEQAEIPGNWVQITTTYREIIRVTGALCQFAQRYQGLVGGRWFSGTVHLNNTFSTLTTQQQQGIRDTAASFGFSQAAIVASATIRDVLKNMADQYLAAGLPLELQGPL